MKPKHVGFLVWQGRSVLTNDPIVVLATPDSQNTKTGPMWQAWILDAILDPATAVYAQKDDAICGNCVHRTPGARTCYVKVQWAPTAVWHSWKAGLYDTQWPATFGKAMRFGAYGDPAAVPFYVWQRLSDQLIREGLGWTGYTHQWKTCDTHFINLLMASVDTEQEQREAQRQGWRTFRVKTPHQAKLATEIVCPASEEAGHRTTCEKCTLCMGAAKRAKSIVINAHGAHAVAFNRMRHNLRLPL